MKKNILYKNIVTALLCGIWAFLSGIIGLIAWAGFAGCTTYFAYGKHGYYGIKKTICTNMVGVICGTIVIFLNANTYPLFGQIGVWCAVITFLMCSIAKVELFNYTPGVFVGCFATFACNEEWALLIISLLTGAILGALCDYCGTHFANFMCPKSDLITSEKQL